MAERTAGSSCRGNFLDRHFLVGELMQTRRQIHHHQERREFGNGKLNHLLGIGTFRSVNAEYFVSKAQNALRIGAPNVTKPSRRHNGKACAVRDFSVPTGDRVLNAMAGPVFLKTEPEVTVVRKASGQTDLSPGIVILAVGHHLAP